MKHENHKMKASSIEAYRDRERTGKNTLDRDRIAELVLRSQDKLTRREIATALKMETSSVAGLVNGLIACHVLYECPESQKEPCPITGKRVHWLIHMSKAGQQELFGGRT